MNKIYIIIEEFSGTDGEFGANATACKDPHKAEMIAKNSISEMVKETGFKEHEVTPETDELKGDGWCFRVRIVETELI